MPLLVTPPEPIEHESNGQNVELSHELEDNLIRVFKLLADKNRLRILMHLLREGELHVSALCERLGQSQPAVSHHLALLRTADFIEVRRGGKHNFYSVKADKFHSIIGELVENISDTELIPD